MPEQTVATPAASVPRDAKTTANNIVQGIRDRTSGKSPSQKPPENIAKTPSEITPPDPNAGKEKYVVDGRDVWLTPEQARSYVQKGISFEPRIDQLARLQQETGAFLQKLSTDPMAILTDKRIGLTPEIVLEKIFASGKIGDSAKESVGKWYWENVVEPMKLSPEQLKAREDAKFRTDHEKQDTIAKDNAIKQENFLRVQTTLNQIKSQIGEAMKESGLPNNDTPLGAVLARRVADVMRLGYFQRQAITPKQAIEKVRAEMREVQSAWYDNLDEENLVKELGEKNADKVKKYYLKLVKEADKKIPDNQKGASPHRAGERKVMNLDEFHNYLDNLKKEGK